MMGKKRNISLLGEVLKNIAGERNWQDKLERHRLFSFWETAVGMEIASHARPKLLRGAVLWVDVTDSVWMQHLHFQKTAILESINARLRGEAIEDIRFQLVKSDGKKQEKADRKVVQRVMGEPRPEESAGFEKMLSSIEDPEIRKSMKTLWLAQKRRKR